jgi:hypothetical protein
MFLKLRLQANELERLERFANRSNIFGSLSATAPESKKFPHQTESQFMKTGRRKSLN